MVTAHEVHSVPLQTGYLQTGYRVAMVSAHDVHSGVHQQTGYCVAMVTALEVRAYTWKRVTVLPWKRHIKSLRNTCKRVTVLQW